MADLIKSPEPKKGKKTKRIMDRKSDIRGLSYEELEKIISREGLPLYRARQVYSWLYLKKVDCFRQMSNVPSDLINRLESLFQLTALDCVKKMESEDGSLKFLFKLNDGHFVESVLIPSKKRNTICISTQIGCPWHCLFCTSGKDGFTRNLKAGEIVGQLISVQQITGKQVNNIVFMGMGEPLNNYFRLMKAIGIINDERGINIGARRMTISTCGIIPGIKRLAENPLQVELSVSLHAADDKTRTFLMPVNRQFPIKKLIAACRQYTEKKNRQITFEYLMLKGINDSKEQAKKLCSLISDFKSKVNLIIYNPIPNLGNNSFILFPSEEAAVLSFQRVLKKSYIPVTVRYSKGQDIAAACGQLRRQFSNRIS